MLPVNRLVDRLSPPRGKVHAVLDTDTYNEVDDQFALAHLVLSPGKVDLQAVYAAPFHNNRSSGPADGMEKSYQEILKVLRLLRRKKNPAVFRGSESWLEEPLKPVESPAARDLVARAKGMDSRAPLYVVAIGAVTNVASAILMEPSIIQRIVVVFLGGQPLHHSSALEFNLMQDPHASRLLFDCGVPLVHIPCQGVASHLLTTLPELEQALQGQNDLGDYLVDIVRGFRTPSRKNRIWSKVIWDISASSWLMIPEAFESAIVHSPVLTDNLTWSHDPSRHFIREVTFRKRDLIYDDVFGKLRNA